MIFKSKIVKITQTEFNTNDELQTWVDSNKLFDNQTEITVVYKHKQTGRKLIRNMLLRNTNKSACTIKFSTCEVQIGLLETDFIKRGGFLYPNHP